MSRGIQNQIVNIFRSSLALGYIPEDWRTARVVFMPKVGKNDLRRTPQPKITWDCITRQFNKVTIYRVPGHTKIFGSSSNPLINFLIYIKRCITCMISSRNPNICNHPPSPRIPGPAR